MLTELILFVSCFGLGVLGRLWYLALMRLQKKINNIPAAITLQFFSAGVFVFGVVLLLFFINSGVFVLYAFIAVPMGFGALSLVL